MKLILRTVATVSLLFSAFASSSAHAAGAKIQGLLGFESFGLREFPMERVVSTTHELGLEYVEVFPGHMDPASEPAKIDASLKLLADKKVRLSAAFVGNAGSDIAANRRLFDYARKLGTRIIIVNEIDERGIEGLNKLCVEYPEIRVCLHNHGPASQGASLAKVQALLTKLNPHVGACIDTGHVMRSREDPVAWVRALKGRIFGVHLKEYHGDRPLSPKSDLATKEVLLELAAAGFPDYGALTVEFEGTPKDPFDGIAQSIDYVRKLIAEINGGK